MSGAVLEVIIDINPGGSESSRAGMVSLEGGRGVLTRGGVGGEDSPINCWWTCLQIGKSE